MQLEVELYGNDIKGAIFEGVFLVLPPSLDILLELGGSNAG